MTTTRTTTVNKLQRAGWVGQDASLDISLFEYGLAWKIYKRSCKGGDYWKNGVGYQRRGYKKGDVKFYYGGWGAEGNEFDWSWLDGSTDVRKEFDWALTDSFFASLGIEEKDEGGWMRSDWYAMPLSYQVADLIGYYRADELFGMPTTADLLVIKR